MSCTTLKHQPYHQGKYLGSSTLKLQNVRRLCYRTQHVSFALQTVWCMQSSAHHNFFRNFINYYFSHPPYNHLCHCHLQLFTYLLVSLGNYFRSLYAVIINLSCRYYFYILLNYHSCHVCRVVLCYLAWLLKLVER